MPDNALPPNPSPARGIASFEEPPAEQLPAKGASQISLDVPLPGAYTIRRIVRVVLPNEVFTYDDWTTAATGEVVEAGGGGAVTSTGAAPSTPNPGLGLDDGDVDDVVFEARFLVELGDAGWPAPTTSHELDGLLDRQKDARLLRLAHRAPAMGAVGLPEEGQPLVAGSETLAFDERLPRIKDLLVKAKLLSKLTKIPWLPRPGFGDSMQLVPVPDQTKPQPALFLEEVYELYSKLTDYGLGRTIQVVPLVPTQQQRVQVRTWRTETSKISESSSIIDSYTTEAAERFQSEVEYETSDKRSDSNNHHWSADVKASGSIGIVSGEAKLSGGGDYHAAREQFSRGVAKAISEHSQKSNAKRENTVTASRDVTVETGREEIEESEYRNVNMRRTLNIVYRELNQQYETDVVLRGVNVVFSDGILGHGRRVPLSGMRGLLLEFVDKKKVERVAQSMLNAIGTIMDFEDKPHTPLQTMTLDPATGEWKPGKAARRDDGTFPAPSDIMLYRVKTSAPGSAEGIVVSRQVVTMRTDTVIAEALMGMGDALDAYATQQQAAEANAKVLANAREQMAQDLMRDLIDSDAAAAAQAWSHVFPPPDAHTAATTPPVN